MDELISVMKALSDPNRIRIVKMLQHKTMCVCEIQATLRIAQPTVSAHLKILEAAGIVSHRKDGLWIDYYLRDGSNSPYLACLLGNLRFWLQDDPEIADFAAMLRNLDVKLMADESACSLEEVDGIIKKGHYDMINVRLSKCGGFRKSFRIIDYLRAEGIPFQIACQLGESGLLSAAGRILSLLNSDALYHDGSYDKFLLKENITDENVSFGPGGEAGPLGGCGLGVKVDNKKLEKLNGGHNKGREYAISSKEITNI